MGNVIWTPLALDDLQHIAEYLRKTNPAKEQQIIGNIVDKADQLENNPYSGQKSSQLSTAQEKLRTLLVDKHLRLVYEVEPNEDVTILQVLDLRSDRPFYR